MTQWIRDNTRAWTYGRDTPEGQRSPACTYCGRAVRIGQLPSDSEAGLAAAVLDHVDPLGGNRRTNLATSCWSCNAEKGERTPDEWEADRLARGLPPVPTWRSRRPEPALSLRERAAAATSREGCSRRSASCMAKILDINERRQNTAEWARRRR